MAREIVQVRKLRDAAAFDAHLATIGTVFPRHHDPAEVLGRPAPVAGRTLANRWAVLPMEGWDGTADGRPTDLVRRRWHRFGLSGAALVWGGEAVAVQLEGRANPRQLAIGPDSVGDLAGLRTELLAGHAAATNGAAPPVIGLQLTHSGRWSRPTGAPAPHIAFRHPWLDEKVGATDEHVVTDGWLDDLVGAYARGAVVAQEAGFDFVDVKHCHGYLLHELLAGHERPGRYGGDLDGRTRLLREAVAAIRRDAPGLQIGVRLSAFDVVPHGRGADERGVPATTGPYLYAFGGDGTGVGIDLTEVHTLCDRLQDWDVPLLCVTAGSPYYCPHVQRPAYFPPSDGYLPPRDPLLEVARLLDVTAEITRAHPALTVVASGLSYLQEWMPAVAAGIVDGGGADLVGYGRGVLSYPELPAHVLAGADTERAKLCRTFSDCTTAPRNGLISGCYPLDPYYKARPERLELTAAKRATGGDVTGPKIALAMLDGLVAHAFTPGQIDRLAAVGELVEARPLASFDEDRAAAVLDQAEVLVGHWGCPTLTPEVLALAPRLRLFAYAAGTVKWQVTDAVWERDIIVTSAAAANAVPVAEYTVAMVVLANKGVLLFREWLRDPTATLPLDPSTVGNYHRRVGLVGASLVGRRVVELLAPYDLEVAVYDPYLSREEAETMGVEKVDDLDALCASVDVLSVHAPDVDATRGMIGAAQLATLRDGAVFLNTARPALVDSAALEAELTSGRIAAILDVTEPEPLPADHPLLGLPNVFVTPHLAGAMGNELHRLAELAVVEVERYARGQPPLHPVQREDLDRIA